MSVFLRLKEPSLQVFSVEAWQAEDLFSLSEKVSPTGRGLLMVDPHPPSVGVKVSVFLRLKEPSLRVFSVEELQAEDLFSLSEKVSPTGRGLLMVDPHPPVPVD